MFHHSASLFHLLPMSSTIILVEPLLTHDSAFFTVYHTKTMKRVTWNPAMIVACVAAMIGITPQAYGHVMLATNPTMGGAFGRNDR